MRDRNHSEWQRALTNNDLDTLYQLLFFTGHYPQPITQPIRCIDGAPKVIDILINGRTGEGCISRTTLFKVARYFREGGNVPEPRLHPETFGDNTRAYLEELTQSRYELLVTLHRQPEVLNLRDQEGQTLLHHIAIGRKNIVGSIIPYLLTRFMTTDHFNTPDNNGNTPVHIAFIYQGGVGVFNFHHGFLEDFLEVAAQKNADFSVQNNDGFEPIHLAARVPSIFPQHASIHNPITILSKAASEAGITIDFMRRSKEQKTAYYYTIDGLRFDLTHTLAALPGNDVKITDNLTYEDLSHLLTLAQTMLQIIQTPESTKNRGAFLTANPNVVDVLVNSFTSRPGGEEIRFEPENEWFFEKKLSHLAGRFKPYEAFIQSTITDITEAQSTMRARSQLWSTGSDAATSDSAATAAPASASTPSI